MGRRGQWERRLCLMGMRYSCSLKAVLKGIIWICKKYQPTSSFDQALPTCAR